MLWGHPNKAWLNYKQRQRRHRDDESVTSIGCCRGTTLLSDATGNRKTFELLQNGTVATISTSYYGGGANTPIYITPGGNEPLVLQSSGTSGNVGIGEVSPGVN